MTAKTAELLHDPHPNSHIVFPYTNEEAVAEAAGMFAAGGLSRDEAVVLIASRRHRVAIAGRLSDQGFDVGQLRQEGRLALFDAGSLLSRLLVDGMPDAERFQRTLGRIVVRSRRAAPCGKLRIFAEILSLLYGRDNAAALRLEEMLDEAIDTFSVPILCTYSLDHPEPATAAGREMAA